MKRSKKKKTERSMRRIAAACKGEIDAIKNMGVTCTALSNPLKKPTKEDVERIMHSIKRNKKHPFTPHYVGLR